MLNRIFRKLFLPALSKRGEHNVKHNPYKINFTDNSSRIISPHKIDGGPHISIGSNVKVEARSWIWAITKFGKQQFNPKIRFGNNVFIGHYACITAIDCVIIEDGCLLSEHVYISDHGHGIDPKKGSPAFQPLISKGPVIIGENSFIGYGARVLPGVKLGRHCVVGANAVVTTSFPDFSMVAGIPARMIKSYSEKTGSWVEV